MDTLPCLREQNEVADTGRYGIEKFPLYCLKCKQESLIDAKLYAGLERMENYAEELG